MDALSPDERRDRAARFEADFQRAISFSAESLAAFEDGRPVPGDGGESDADRKAFEFDLLDLNAWLSERAGEWMAQQNVATPDGMGGFAVWTERGDPVLGGEVRGQVFSARVSVAIGDDGKAVVRPEQGRGGSLDLPVSRLLQDATPALEKEGYPGLSEAVTGKPFEPVVPIDATRQTRITAFKLDGERVRMELKAEPRP